MKILALFSNISYPPREGLHANSVNFLKNLSESGFDCAMAAFQRCGHPFDYSAFSADLPRVRVLSIIPTSHRYHLLTLRNLARAVLPLPGDRFGRALDKILAKEDFDLVHIEGLPLAPYIGRFRDLPVAASMIDAFSRRQMVLMRRQKNPLKRLYFYCAAGFGRFVEERFLPRADLVHVVSEVDAKWLSARMPGTRVAPIPICLCEADGTEAPSPGPDRAGAKTMLFSGDLNVDYIAEGLDWFLRQCLPLIREKIPDLKVEVLGRRSARSFGEEYAPPPPGVRFVKWVENYLETLARADLVFLPDASGSGLKSRALQAMALGLPVIGTRAAFEGIPTENRVQAFITDDAAEFAGGAADILLDPKLAESTGAAAREFVQAWCAREPVMRRWKEEYARAVEHFRAGNKNAGSGS